MRKRIYNFLIFNVFRIPIGQKIPKHLLWIPLMLFPIRFIWYFNPWLQYEANSHCLIINKYPINIDFLLDMANGEFDNRSYTISRKDGKIYFTEVLDDQKIHEKSKNRNAN